MSQLDRVGVTGQGGGASLAGMFRAAPPSSLLVERLDALTAVYHRASGITHLLGSPAPEILDALREPASLDALLDRLAADFEVADADRGSLAARLDELVEAGLVERS